MAYDSFVDACRLGYFERARRLLSEGADPNERGGYSRATGLHWACFRGDLAMVKTIIEDPQCEKDSKDDDGSTPLHWACENEQLKVAHYLISEQHCNPQCTDNSGQTPLHYASRYGYLEIVQCLLSDQRCDPQCVDKDGMTPLHLACKRGYLEIVRCLLSDQRCDPQCVDKDGMTPLHFACKRGYLEIVRCLLSDQRCDPQCVDKDGMTPLHFACNESRTNVAKFLLSEGVDPNCTTKDGRTPLSLTRDTNIIRELLLRGANTTTMYHEQIRGDLLLEVSVPPPESSAKVFMVGDVGAGKSSLTAALKKESKSVLDSMGGWLAQVSGVEQRTAGIIPHEITSQKLGRLTLYDLAGHKEYHSSHDTVLRSNMTASSAAIFLLVTDLAKSDEEFRTTVLYWLAFLNNQCTSTSTKPYIIIVGSHADAVSSKVQRDKKAIIDSLASDHAFASFRFTDFVAMDCRYSVSSSMSELRKRLAEACKSLRESTQIDLQSHLFLVYLLDKFRHLPAASLGEILSYIQKHSGKDESNTSLVISRRMPNTVSSLYRACEELNARGNLLFLRNMKTPKNSWLVLDKDTILSKVTGSVFAPESFKQHCKLANSIGVVPLSNIETHFPTLHPNMIACLLSHFNFCHEITREDVELLQSPSSSAQEKYYFFPALITIDTPSEVLKDTSKFNYHSAWQLRAEQFFTPRFLPVLLLRLAFSFALAPDSQEVSSDFPALQRKCSVWKNGINWCNRQGVEALVEVGKDSLSTTVMVRSQKGSEIACIYLRSALLQTVLETHKDFCPQVTISESFFHPDNALSYPLQLKHSPCTTTEIARAVAEGASYIVGESGSYIVDKSGSALTLETLLHFDPYADLGEAMLLKLFDEASPDYTKPADARIIEHISHNIKPVIGQSRVSPSSPAFMLQNLISRSHSNITYRDLRAVLDQFSVFAGRNPLELSGQLSPVPTDAAETQAKPHPLTSAQGDDSTAPAHPDVGADIPRKLDKPRLYELQRLRGREGSVIRVIRDVAAQWDDLAIALHFNHEEKAAIQRNTFFQVEAACEEVLGEWLSGGHRTPVTWNTLLEALRDCDFINLARDLEKALH